MSDDTEVFFPEGKEEELMGKLKDVGNEYDWFEVD